MSEDIIEILETFSRLNIHSLKYKTGDMSIELEKDSVLKKEAEKNHSSVNNVNLNSENNFKEEITTDEKITIKEEPDTKKEENYFKVKAPLVGIFYSKPAPDAEPFTKLGNEVKQGDVLCVIEAMKMYNEIKSPINGTVKAIKFNDEEVVQYNDIIFEIEERC